MSMTHVQPCCKSSRVLNKAERVVYYEISEATHLLLSHRMQSLVPDFYQNEAYL